MNDLLSYILHHLVSQPDKVSIEERREENGLSVYFIHADKSDMGKVIGKGGKIIRAIRSMAKVRAVKESREINVELLEVPLKAE